MDNSQRASAPHHTPPPAYHIDPASLAGLDNDPLHLAPPIRSTVKANMILVATIACCLVAGAGAGVLVSSYALRGVAPLTGALIGGGAALGALGAKAVCDKVFGTGGTQARQLNANQPPAINPQVRQDPVRTIKTIENAVATAIAVLSLEAGLCAIMTSSFSALTGVVFGVTSALVDTIVNIAFNLLHLENRWIKLACKIAITGLVAMTALQALGLPTLSLMGIIALKIGVKHVLMPMVMEFLNIQTTPPLNLLKDHTIGTRNLLDNHNVFELKNFMWPTPYFS